MINLISIFLTIALFAIGFVCFNLVKINQSLYKLNQMNAQNEAFIQSLYKRLDKRLADLELNFDKQLEALKAIPKERASSTHFVSKEAIEQNYERAKSLLKRGLPLDRDLMQSCNITEEEFELLGN